MEKFLTFIGWVVSILFLVVLLKALIYGIYINIEIEFNGIMKTFKEWFYGK